MERLRTAAFDDVRHAASLALAGSAAFVAVELVAVRFAAQTSISLSSWVNFALLAVTLASVLFAVATGLLGGFSIAARAMLGLARPSTRWGAQSVLALRRDGGRAWLAPLLWALAAGGVLYIGSSAGLTIKLTKAFREPTLTAVLLGVLQIGLVAVCTAIGYVVFKVTRWLGDKLRAKLGGLNPFGNAAAATALLVLIVGVSMRVAAMMMPQIRGIVPWRHFIALCAFVAGAYVGAELIARRGSLLPKQPTRRRMAFGAVAAFVLVLAPYTLLKAGADPEAKLLAETASPTMGTLITVVRKANDVDGDGYSSLLGEKDCAPWNSKINPEAREIPGNGVDENCNGLDGPMPRRAAPGEDLPVPEAFQQDWNILLLTVDTVRYDHTGFGGYERDTTPWLDGLVKKSISFDFCNAPSAGTMATIPAILTSKFFHSGIALDDTVKPPKLLPSNMLVQETMKERGYFTGAFLTHDYFLDWGMDQGFDTYDTSLGPKREPKSITSDRLTDKALGWIGKHGNKKWFLWLHYFDPHGRYVAHPGGRSFGKTEKDLYDGELHYTDKHIGRLIEAIWRTKNGSKTIIAITSDHGDGFKEHGHINHGMALYKEMIHVPLIFYIPDAEPRVVGGAVSPMDVYPTLADLVGADTSDLGFEGRSLVPQLFYGIDDHERVVFSETNWPKPLRAAVSSTYKLIYKLTSNVYELYNLKKDPFEKKNIAKSDRKGLADMRRHLDSWLERVYYSRDLTHNQSLGRLRHYLLDNKPTPKQPIEGVTFDNGKIELLGMEVSQQGGAGGAVKVDVFFRAADRPSGRFKMQVAAWDGTGKPGHLIRSRQRDSAKGILSTERWRKGEFIRDTFTLKVPASWKGGDKLTVGLRMTNANVSLPPSRVPDGSRPKYAAIGRTTLGPPVPQPVKTKPGTPAKVPSKLLPTPPKKPPAKQPGQKAGLAPAKPGALRNRR